MGLIQKKLSAMKNYDVKHTTLLHYGSVLNGYDVRFSCLLSGFLSQGEVFVFGEMLSNLMASSLPINTFVCVTITIEETGEELVWPARTLDQVLI